MIISRPEIWGKIKFDTISQTFSYAQSKAFNELPYVRKPVVLNCDLTLDCNMACLHCVARDMRRYCKEDMKVSSNLIRKINESPFMMIAITGGEPLLPPLEDSLVRLISGIKHKGIMVDTNGCIEPSKRVLRTLIKKKVLLRISLDSMRIQDEVKLRMKREHQRPWADKVTIQVYRSKLSLIPKLVRMGVKIGIQSVLHQGNLVSIFDIPKKMEQWSIHKWFVQRLIPTRRMLKDQKLADLLLKSEDYEREMKSIEKKAAQYGVECFTKKDRRHNCVFLMVGDGHIYTQSDIGGEKIPLGQIGEIKDYFAYVSSSEHSSRYYDVPREICDRSRREVNRH